MTKEDKQLLLKDLCARLPYGIEIFYSTTIPFATLITINAKKVDCIVYDHSQWYKHSKFNIETIKPYLRPMSSMTDEEIDRMWEIYESGPVAESSVAVAEYLYERHLDCHYLIEKGLALEAPADMYKND
jgi:hypothetical protein